MAKLKSTSFQSILLLEWFLCFLFSSPQSFQLYLWLYKFSSHNLDNSIDLTSFIEVFSNLTQPLILKRSDSRPAILKFKHNLLTSEYKNWNESRSVNKTHIFIVRIYPYNSWTIYVHNFEIIENVINVDFELTVQKPHLFCVFLQYEALKPRVNAYIL